MISRIAITPGEPAGIGPDICLQVAQLDWPAQLIAIADKQLLNDRAKQLGLTIKLKDFDAEQKPEQHTPGELFVLEHKLEEPAVPGEFKRE